MTDLYKPLSEPLEGQGDSLLSNNAELSSSTSAASPIATAVTKIPRSVSVKIKILTLFGIFCVVYTHSYNGYPRVVNSDSVPSPADWATFFQFLLVSGILRFAVPMFFCFSGYLFFVHKASDTRHFGYKRRFISRCKSIVVPYIEWNVISALLIALSLQSKTVLYYWPWHKHWLNASWQTVVDSLVYPVPYPLWYLRDLFFLVLLTPVFHALFKWTNTTWAYRYIPGFGLLLVPLACLFPWYLASWPLAGYCVYTFCPSLYILDLDGLIYFPLGCWFALSGKQMTQAITKWQLLLLTSAWIGINVLKTSLAFSFSADDDRSVLTTLFKTGVLLGVPSVWFACDFVRDAIEGTRLWECALWASPYAMWIYCAHEPMMGLCLELIQPWLSMCTVVNGGNLTSQQTQYCRHDANPIWFFLLYIMGGLIWISFLLLLGVSLSRYVPTVFQWLTGGRGGGRPKQKPKIPLEDVRVNTPTAVSENPTNSNPAC